jgi:hypothetical protein
MHADKHQSATVMLWKEAERVNLNRVEGASRMAFYRQKASVVHEKFGDETVIVNLDTGCYFSIDGAADTIWGLAIAGLSNAEILTRGDAAYTGDRDRVRAETEAFLARLVEEQLVEPTDSAPAGTRPSPPDEPQVWISPTLQKFTDMEEMLQLDPIHAVDEMGWPQAKKAGT